MTEVIDQILTEYPEYVTRYLEGDEVALELLCAILYSRVSYREDTSYFKEKIKERITLS